MALLLGTYTLAGFALLPALAERKLPALVQEKTGAKLTLGAVRFNPFRFILEADGIRLLDAVDRPLLSLEKLYVDASLTDSLAARRPLIRKIRLGTPEVHWQRLTDGASNFSRLFESFPAGESESTPPRIDRLLLEKGALEFVDEARHQTIALRELEFDAENLLAEAGAAAPFTLKALSAEGETLDVHGTVQLDPWALHGDGRLDQFKLPFWWRYFGGAEGLALESGALALDTPFSWTSGEKPAWSLGPGRLRLSGIRLNDATKNPLLEAAELNTDGLAVDGAARRVDAARLTARGLRAQAWRSATGFHFGRGAADAVPVHEDRQEPAAASHSPEPGGAEPQDVAQPTASADQPAPPAAESIPHSQSAWSYRAAAAEVADSSVIFEDRTVSAPVRVELSGVHVTTGAVDSAADAPIALELSGAFNREGRVALQGEVTPRPLAAHLKIEVAQIALPPFRPWLERWMRLELQDGALRVAGELDYRQVDGAPQTRFSGEMGVVGLRAVETGQEKELLAWKDLSLKGVDLAFPSGGLRVAAVEAERPYARVIINADKTLNWADTFGVQAPGSKTAAKAKGEGAGGFPVDIGTIRIREGLADFADLTLKPNFVTSIHGLNGAIKDLSSSPSARARVLLEGQVERYSPVRIQGLVNPFRASAFSDIEMKFQNVDLTRLSPYSGKFAGYRIEKGKMSLNLHYLLQNRQLDAENQIVLNHLTLGEQVPSKDATSLPLRLAVALLKDADGNIDIDLPIRGNLDDPQFSLGGLYGKAVVQLISKLVASPFTVFGNLLEGAPEEYGYIVFKPGRAKLPEARKEKLEKLALAMKTREDLNLEIRGVAHAEQDRLALAERRLDKAIRQQWRAEQRAKGKNPSKSSKLVVPEDDAQRILTQLFRAASGENGSPPDGHPSEAFLAYARKVVVDKTVIDEAELRLLAQKRGEAVRNFLVQGAGLPEQRIFLLDVQVVSQPDQEAKTLLMLNGS
ncbi:MAG TPA: DUF748 domain-containing protein [Methylococcaceae bacterium]|nr:DUF748 domain-containing protein [Methylococcaceae bacterium]